MDSPQPIIISDEPFSEIEIAYNEDQPAGLFPENQDSNFGFHRKVFCDQLMEAANQLQLIENERFVDTATQFLDVWESEVGITADPVGASIATRRGRVKAHIQRGPFTTTRRKAIIEQYIEATFGAVPSFGTSGLDLSAGIPLHAPAGTTTNLYSIVENISGFSYTVYIQTSITPDINALTRELTRITPAGISFSIVFVDEPLWPTNYVTNPSFETNTTDWQTFGTNTIARSTTRAKYGTASLLATYQNDLRLAQIGATVPNKQATYTGFAWVYIPANWDGGQITIGDDGAFTNAGFVANVNADMSLRDQWQRIYYTYTIADDTIGAIFIRAASAPTAGRQIYIDGVYMTPQHPNLASQNPGAELTTPFSPPWNPNFGTTTRDTTVFHSGIASVKQVTPGISAGEGLYNFNSLATKQVTPGKTYKASCWINLPVGKQVKFEIYWLDTKNNYVSSGNLVLVNGTGTWQQISVTSVAPVGADNAIIDWYTTSIEATTYYVDDLILEEVPVAPSTPV